MKAPGKRRQSRAINSKRPVPGVPNQGVTRRFRAGWLALVCAGLVAGVWFALPLGNKPAPHVAVNSTRPQGAPSPEPQSARPGKNNEDLARQIAHANELLAQSKTAEATEVLNAAVKAYPDDEDAHYNLGVALARQGRFDESLRQYEEAVRIFPNYVEAHNNMGNVLMRLGRTQDAITQYETAVKLLPDYASALNNLGTALQRAGRTNEALQHFQQAVKAKPDYWEAHFNFGTSCLAAGRFNEASNEFETVLRLKPDFQPARTALDEVRSRQ